MLRLAVVAAALGSTVAATAIAQSADPARKGAAKLKATGSAVYYHEYLEGGHSVGADRAEDAKRAALLWAFLTRELKPAQ